MFQENVCFIEFSGEVTTLRTSSSHMSHFDTNRYPFPPLRVNNLYSLEISTRLITLPTVKFTKKFLPEQ